MPGGSDQKAKKLLTVPTARTERRSSSLSIPLDTRSSSEKRGAKPRVVPTSTTQRKLPFSPALTLKHESERSPIQTRSVVKILPPFSTMALSIFTSVSDKLCQFESRVNGPASEDDNVYTYELRRDRLQCFWDKVEAEYIVCSRALSQDPSGNDVAVMEGKYEHCYTVYERCISKLKGQISRASVPEAQPAPAPLSYSGGCRLPPCDTEVFHGDYLRWPNSH